MSDHNPIFAEEREVALHHLVAVLQEAAMRFTYVASLIEDSELSAQFLEISTEKQQQTETVMTHIRSMGYLVKEMDQEKELLEELFIKLKALIASDTRKILLQELLYEENSTRESLEQALTHKLPDSFRMFLQKCRQDLGLELKRLLAELGP